MGSEVTDDGVETDLVMIEVAEDIVLLLGDGVPAGFELEPFYLDQTSRGELTGALAMAAGAANVGILGAGAMQSIEGLVRLSPETVNALKSMTPLTKDGWNLGALRDANGIAHSVRWGPATGGQATSFMTSLGPAMVLLAVAAQVAAMDKKLDQAVAIGGEILGQLRSDHQSRLSGICRTIDQAVREAKEVGSVTEGVFAPVVSVISDLNGEHDAFFRYFEKHRKMLQPGSADREKYVDENADAIIADAQGLILADLALYRYGILSAGRILDSESDDDARKLSRSRVERTERKSRESLDRTLTSIDDVYAQIQILNLTSRPSVKDRILLQRQPDRRLTAGDRVAAAIGPMLGNHRSNRHDVNPVIAVGKDLTDAPLDILKWALDPDEALLALAEARPQGLTASASYLGITPTRVFVTSERALLRDGEIEESYPLEDLRYVRLAVENEDRANIDIITKDENLGFRLSAKDSMLEVQKLADLLMSAAEIPDSERRPRHMLDTPPTRAALISSGDAPQSGVLSDSHSIAP